jgi:hypothetical protein
MRVRLLLATIATVGTVVSTGPAFAQQATPDSAGAPKTCSVEPRSTDEIATLVASPVAGATPEADLTGNQVDDKTLEEVQNVVLEADLCAQAGDLNRLAALYSDHALQTGVLNDEAVPIEPGTPAVTPTSGDGQAASPPSVSLAFLLNDGRVLAYVERGSSVYQVFLVKVDGEWRLDSGETKADEMIDDSGGAGGTPVDAGMLPIVVLQAVASEISKQAGEDVANLTIDSYEAVEWNDAFLGCPVEGEFAAQVITPGYRIMATYKGKSYEVHTDLDGNAASCVGGE